MEYSTQKTDYKAISEAIDKLKTLKEKLQYYNDNYLTLILTNNDLPKPSVKIIYYNDYTVYCTCKDCESKFSITDFEVYRNFINNQTDNIVKYFNKPTDYKAKLEYYFKLNGNRPTKAKLVLKYVPNSKDELKDYYNLKEVIIDVTPKNEIEFNVLLDLKKSIILNSENNQKPQRTPIQKGTEYYNASRFIYENRVDEVTNCLELIVDENDRKDLIKKYLDSINLDKIDFEKIKIKRKFTHEFSNYEILKTANKIIQKINYDEVVNTTDFFEVENYLLALETIKFKKYLNSLLIPKPQLIENLKTNQQLETKIDKAKAKDYTALILKGIANNSEYLTEYFVREQKVAENELIQKDEFFRRCNDVLKLFVESLNNDLQKRKRELYFMLNEAKNKTSIFDEKDLLNSTYDKLCEQTIDYCNLELKTISINDFSIHLHSLTNGNFTGSLMNSNIENVKFHLENAKNELNLLDANQLKQKIETRQKENLLSNQQTLNEYYKSIKNAKYFESDILNRESETYYKKITKEYTEYKNSELLTNENLNCRIGVLKPFNLIIETILNSIVHYYKTVLDWKKNNTELHENNLEIRFSSDISYLKNDFIQSIKLNYDTNPILALALKEYCVNGFDLMVSLLNTELLINFEKSPLFPKFKELTDKFENAIDYKKVEVLSKLTPGFLTNKEPQQTEVKSNISTALKHNNIFKNNSFEVFEKYHKLKSINESCRTDLRIIFELMKNDSLLVETVELKHYILWLNKTYSYSLIELKKLSLNTKPNLQRTNEYNEIKRTTLK